MVGHEINMKSKVAVDCFFFFLAVYFIYRTTYSPCDHKPVAKDPWKVILKKLPQSIKLHHHDHVSEQNSKCVREKRQYLVSKMYC